MINWGKPIETVDGGRATYIRPSRNGRGTVIVATPDNPYGAGGSIERVYDADGGTSNFPENPKLRNKMVVDWGKPIELEDGSAATFIQYETNIEGELTNWVRIGVEKQHQPIGLTWRSYNKYTGEHCGSGFSKRPSVRNKMEKKMIDKSKPITAGGIDAKIIHTFDDGRMAVIVAGNQNVLTFPASGYLDGYGSLKNKVERTEKFINVYPTSTNSTVGTTSTKPTYAEAKDGRNSVRQANHPTAFTVKQTFEDGKLVSTEVVDV